MPILLNAATDWELRAWDVLCLAAEEHDPVTKAWLAGVAAEFERLAKLTAEHQATNRRDAP
jgi:hypothetical protein